MRPESCKNCCATEFIEKDDEFVCAYCDTRYPKPRTEVCYVQVPVQIPVQVTVSAPEPVRQVVPTGKMKRKWTAFFLCLFLGPYGAHKFYEGKIGMGILYFFTAGLFGFGWIADCIAILRKQDPYYV